MSGYERVEPSSWSLPVPASPVKALTAPRNRLPEMFSRWPRYRSHGPAAEMWSVVHLPWALSSTARSTKSLPVPRRERLEQLQPFAVGADVDLTPVRVGRRGEEAGLRPVEALRELVADRLGQPDRSAVDVVSVSVSGSKSSVPARASAITVSGEVTKARVAALPSLRLGKLRL